MIRNITMYQTLKSSTSWASNGSMRECPAGAADMTSTICDQLTT
jgi:hypothetical protein